jgi:molecular chaperone GrpE
MSQFGYNPYRRSARTRTLTEMELAQIDAALRRLERENEAWKKQVRSLEQATSESQAKAEQWEFRAEELGIVAANAREQAAEWEAKAQDLKAEVAELKEQSAEDASALPDVQEEAAELRDRLIRAQADYENTKKRLERRFALQTEQQTMDLVRDLLPVMDNLDRAVAALPQRDGDDCTGLREGLDLTRRTFTDALARHGATPITAVGEPFDPNLHEAVGTVPDTDAPPSTVVQVEEVGFTYRDKLLRPSRVLITESAG